MMVSILRPCELSYANVVEHVQGLDWKVMTVLKKDGGIGQSKSY